MLTANQMAVAVTAISDITSPTLFRVANRLITDIFSGVYDEIAVDDHTFLEIRDTHLKYNREVVALVTGIAAGRLIAVRTAAVGVDVTHSSFCQLLLLVDITSNLERRVVDQILRKVI